MKRTRSSRYKIGETIQPDGIVLKIYYVRRDTNKQIIRGKSLGSNYVHQFIHFNDGHISETFIYRIN